MDIGAKLVEHATHGGRWMMGGGHIAIFVLL
jgi:hypothetical protein